MDEQTRIKLTYGVQHPLPHHNSPIDWAIESAGDGEWIVCSVPIQYFFPADVPSSTDQGPEQGRCLEIQRIWPGPQRTSNPLPTRPDADSTLPDFTFPCRWLSVRALALLSH
jgi:hypothetical protein